jgi:predicted amidohydrolase YtcJ
MINAYLGDIISCDVKNSLYRCLIEEDGMIVFLGDSLPDKYAGVRTTEFTGALMPSFVDTHLHFSSYAIFAATTDIKSAGSHEEMLEMLLEYDRREIPKNILSFGASAHSVKEKRLMTREELDKAFPSKPVSIVCYDGHSSINNTAMLNRYEKAVREARGFDAQSGNITREAFYLATDYVTSQVSLPTLIGKMSAAFDKLAANGVGLIHAAEGVGFPGIWT